MHAQAEYRAGASLTIYRLMDTIHLSLSQNVRLCAAKVGDQRTMTDINTASSAPLPAVSQLAELDDGQGRPLPWPQTGAQALPTGRRPAPAHSVIDCDIHNELSSIDLLLPYLAERWCDYIRESAFRGPHANDYPRGALTSARPGSIRNRDEWVRTTKTHLRASREHPDPGARR